MSFANLYYKRRVATPRPCYVCYRPTDVVLATKDAVDYVYTCESHLKDPGFAAAATEEGTGTPKAALSEEEIRRVKEEWEEKQKRRREREKEERAKAAKDKPEDAAAGDKKEDKAKDAEQGKASSPVPQKRPESHERYVLHRDMFRMRVDEHRKRRQAAQAKAVAPRLPSAPRG